MDLENFNEQDTGQRVPKFKRHSDPKELLQQVDTIWYIPTSRRGRWMDLVGDYAGREPFVIDGEALFQVVLDDPLLSLGRPGQPTFQILHAIYALERLLLEFKSRYANIDVVFWNSTKGATMAKLDSTFAITSRLLAWKYLYDHLSKLDLVVLRFDDLEDPGWIEYYARQRPMLVMTNDGGLLTNNCDDLRAQTIVIQRTHIYELLSSKIPVALLEGAKYQDSKILTFIFESGPSSEAMDRFFQSVAEFGQRTVNSKIQRRLQGVQSQFSDGRTADGLPSAPERHPPLHAVADVYPTELPPELLYVFAYHWDIVPFLSVTERAQAHRKLHPELEKLLEVAFYPIVFHALSAFSTSDLPQIDGEIFRCLLRMVIANPSHMICSDHTMAASQIDSTFLSDLRDGSKMNFLAFSAKYPLPVYSVPTSEPLSYKLLPFNNRVVNAELLDIQLPTTSESTDDELALVLPKMSHGTTFLDNTHWHSKKMILPSHLGGEDSRPKDEFHRRRILKAAQRFMTNLQAQAATLTGASGNVLQQIVIPAVGTGTSRRSTKGSVNQNQNKNTYRGKAKGLSSADKRRLEIANEKASRDKVESEKWWEEKLSSLKKSSVSAQITAVDALLQSKRTEEPTMGVEVRLYRLHLELLSWIEDADRESDQARDRYTVSIMRMLKGLLVDQRWPIDASSKKALTSTIRSLGFEETLSTLLEDSNIPPDLPPSRLRFKFVKLISSRTHEPYHAFMRIKEDPIYWQLRLFGPFMDRSMDSAPDRRVAFQPDAWQREVLDCIDANKSLLVVAPTSAGKTFISYYAMEKVLRSSDDGVLVYVAPTKALVTQVAAEVYARFSKSLNGKSCWAIHTRDYRINDPQKCQILVTVPEVLAIMLLSPPLAKVWTPRLKRIVLDEIHSIGQQEGGAVWEQILLLAPCPIIGLSATIGSPELFNDWLATVQKAHNFDHRFIQWPHRYSHLRKFFYDLNVEQNEPFTDLASHQASTRMRFLHPISLMSFGARSLPPDLSLEPRDVLVLYQQLAKEVALEPILRGLQPASFFSTKTGLLRQKDVLEYEAKLKELITEIISGSASSPEHRSSFAQVIHALEDSNLVASPKLSTSLPSKTVFKENIIHLLADLNTSNELPAIVFNFDRTECEVITKSILKSLKDAEKIHRANSKSWQAKVQAWEQWVATSKERNRQIERMKKSKLDKDEQESLSSSSWQSTFNPNDPLDEFTFAGIKCGYSKKELEEEIWRLKKWQTAPSWAIEALRRGIAVHHAGMNKRYRSLVETLFRRGYVRVIIATGTLALGINAPAKTCIFAGDSPYLTALMYRQCSGRAGRRGYDLLGNVVFYGITYDRVQRLVLSQLPVLGGTFPMTTTLTMRLLNLLEGSDYSDVAKHAVSSILAMPQVGFRSHLGHQQVSHHVRFSIELLRRSRLIDDGGRPINLFAIAAHLYYTEPSNFLLVTLLQQGVLHSICSKGVSETSQKDFILIMAHLFGRRYLPRILTDEIHRKKMSKLYPSMILLPPLPESAQQVLRAYNDLVLHTSTGYMVAYARNQASALEAEDRLPLSGELYGGNPSRSSATVRSHLLSTSSAFLTRSPFVANSGHGDSYSSIKELCRTLRKGLYLPEHSIPYLTCSNSSLEVPDEENEDTSEYLNAYLLDFFIHGQLSTLSNANGIRRGDVWYLLQDFTLTLKTIKSALEQLLLRVSETGEESGINQTSEGSEMEDGFDEDEDGDTDEDGGHGEIPRPKGVSEADWNVYQVVCAATDEFEQKFKAIWA